MPNLYFLIIVILFSITGCASKKIEGSFIDNNDSVRFVTFKIPSTGGYYNQLECKGMEKKVKYYDERSKKKILLPNEAKEIRLYYKYDTLRWQSCLIRRYLLEKKYFLFLEIDGEMKLYRTCYFESGMHYKAEAYFQKKMRRCIIIRDLADSII